MRLKSVVWVQAYIRRCSAAGAFAGILHHGDDDAGAIFIKISLLNGFARLYGPAPAGLDDADGRAFEARQAVGLTMPEADADARLAKEREFDRDAWVVEVEDREGRHFLDGWLAESRR